MGQLAFLDDDRLFDRECIRFKGVDGTREVVCGVTLEALKAADSELQRHGLLPAELFLVTFERLIIPIHDVARAKYSRREFEAEGAVEIMVHRRDLAP